MTDCKYPQIKVDLIGNDGNAFSVLGQVKKALKNGGVSAEEIAEFFKDGTSGDYNHLLMVVMDWVEVGSTEDNKDDDEDDEDDYDDYLSRCDDCGEWLEDCTCDDDDEDDDDE